MPGRRGFWVALVLFIGLFAWIRFVELPRHRARSEAEPDSVFMRVPAIRVRAFTVAFLGDTTRVERDGPDWWVVNPVRYPADPVAIQGFLARCENLPVGRVFPFRPVDASRYGLDLPSCVTTLEETDGRVTRLVMGAPAPATPAFYVRVNDRAEVGLLGDHDADNFFRRTRDQWRLRRLLRFAPARAVAVELSAGEHRVRVERPSLRDPWRVVWPFPGLASETYLQEYLKGLSFTAALSFPADVPGPLGAYGLDPGGSRVEVTEEGGRSQTLWFGSDLVGVAGPAQIYARLSDRPQVFGAPAGYRDLALRSDLEFRDRRIFRQALDQYRSFQFEAGGARLSLVPDSAGSWIDSREASRPHAVDRRELVTDWVVAQADSVLPADGESAAWFAGRAVLRIEAVGPDATRERLEVAAVRRSAGGGEFWPARLVAGEPQRREEVFALSGTNVRPVLALLAR